MRSTAGGAGKTRLLRRSSTTPSTARRSRRCTRRSSRRSPTSAVTCARRHACSARDAGLPWWDLFASVGDPAPSECTWTKRSRTCATRSRRTPPRCSHWPSGPSPSDGSTRGSARRQARRRVLHARTRRRSRVLLNFSGTFDGVSTLAHELGHAYHNTNLAERTAMQRQTPMALAETASIFCETILVQSGLAAAAGDAARQLVLLDSDLTGATQVVSTSIRASCSRPGSSSSASTARCP